MARSLPQFEEPVDDPKMGRPSKLNGDDAVEVVARMSLLGLTIESMAKVFGVHINTFTRWLANDEEFRGAVKKGAAQADCNVVQSLYNRALGYKYTEQQAIKLVKKFGKGESEEYVQIVEVERVVPADTTACIFWLKNRQKAQWRDKVEVGVTDTKGKDLPLDQIFLEAAKKVAFILSLGAKAQDNCVTIDQPAQIEQQ